MSFSENMQYLRKKENLTQEQLADRTGQDLSFIAGSLYLAGEIRTAAAAWMEEER